MSTISFKTEVTLEELYKILSQLSTEDKMMMAKKLIATATAERWQQLSDMLPDSPMNMEEVIDEIKWVRNNR